MRRGTFGGIVQGAASTVDQAARDLAENARQMVLRRDPRLDALDQQQATLTTQQQTLTETQAQLIQQQGSLATQQTTLAQQQAQLEQLAATLGAAIPAADATHAGMWAAINDLATKVNGLLANKTTVAFGSKALTGSLLAGATSNVVVTYDKNIGGTDYSLGYSLEGGTSLLGALVINGVTARTATSVTIQVRNTGLTSLANLSGAAVHAVAARVAP